MAKKAQAGKSSGTLSVFDGIMMLTGIVIGIGIFKAPTLVAANSGSGAAFIGLWVLGGFVALVGALCYAELGSSHASSGGEYHFLSKAYGEKLGMLFGWARCTIIQPGAIAAVAFVYGEYISEVINLGRYSFALHGALAVVILTWVNLVGLREASWTQNFFAIMAITALIIAILAAFYVGKQPNAAAIAEPPTAPLAAAGFAMVFILLTFGGWNESAYLSGELRDVKRSMAPTLIWSILIITALYVLVNLGYLWTFGLQGLRDSKAIGADLMRLAAGNAGAIILSLMITATALSTVNATIFTGARGYQALGKDLPWLGFLAKWKGDKPANALITQAILTLILIGFGALARDGFETMTGYTAPAFWGFLFLVGVSVYVFRSRGDVAKDGFKVPLYPVLPAIFCASCLWMCWSGINYALFLWSKSGYGIAGIGAMLGIFLMLLGIPLVLLTKKERAKR
ncbi:MAG: amino acid permease [Xanthobacteraceae bacterium]|nr:amino acid permease [Xanthobacteraceae bacterium]